MPKNNETSLQVNNSSLQISPQEAEKVAKSLQVRIGILRRELEELQTLSINIPDRFATFCKQYFNVSNIIIFSMRDFRKSFHTYMKNKRNFTVNQLQTMLEDYCQEKNLLLYPTSANKEENHYCKYIHIKGKAQEYALIVAHRDNKTTNAMIETFAKEANKIKEENKDE